ncbi:glycosyltransferase family 17 protein [Stereum hirsutum FP-91666 SS1]|uniref:glycosyltransferase family 17 protein n=1 Tax=Stereum hirsutum (strain FP-91666) TaxID=721885 RepID=UPI000444A7B8|nr:glycosyltransferase family 17 protein [Stereum hirsutum FP-91666 SS1]EIM84428.1 glycosyltransferase family 17 protein [Stereum hirsutum FP-91666 SS1]
MLSNRRKVILIPSFILSCSLVYYISLYHYQLRNTLSYATRPLWDHADGPKEVIPHYYAEGMAMDAHACALHSWTPRRQSLSGRQPVVLDAVLMSSELDLLEIRMSELDDVVDKFVIVESNATFTGLPKETYFADARRRFERFESKIVYQFLPGYPLTSDEGAWDVERRTRDTMTQLLRTTISDLRTDAEVLVIMSDVDEIPSRHTISLLQACDFGHSIHLQLRNFLYSFEWYIGPSSWRASVHRWWPDAYYRHSQSSPAMLADSGWHCSFCFRTIPEYVVKMKGFSHSDRIGGDLRLLDPKRIQDTICSGKDIFGMLPEAYSWADLISQMSLEPLATAVGLPRYLIENAERFRFLLPRGCMREPPS